MAVVLGISAFYHDAAACLVRDGEVVFAVQEERLSRVKNDRSFPERAIAACLGAGGVGAGALDAVVFYEKTLPKLERQLDTWVRAFPRSLRAFVGSLSRWLDGRLDLRSWLARRGFGGEILLSEHHLSHAATAWACAPFDDCAVLVADGVGEWATTSLWDADAGGLRPVWEIPFPDSLGLFYSIVTAHLGFRVNEDEYKVMGLSAYGEDTLSREVERLLPFDGAQGFRLAVELLDLAGRETMSTPALERLLGPPRRPGAPVEARHRDLARSAQVRLEAALERLTRELAPGRPLALGGGVAQNGLAIARLGAGRPVSVPFAAGDAGGAVGAALVGARALGDAVKKISSPYLGPRFDADAMAAAARAEGLRARPLAGLDEVAQALSDGKILGWFEGACELGPRALGHRSILADPRDATTRDRVNDRIKHREPFRPFAPALPLEALDRYFDCPRPVPWMTEIHPVRAERRAELGAVVHVDGTARLQSVRREDAPRFHALLQRFGEETGVPVLLNTSFNVAGEPIVCSPTDACRCLRTAGLDGLILGDLWVG